MKESFKPGRYFVVKSVDHSHRAGKTLIDMGLTPDTIIYVDRVAPLGEPYIIKVRNYNLALRKSDLKALEVESVTC